MNNPGHNLLKLADAGLPERFNFRRHKTASTGLQRGAAAGSFSLRGIRNGAWSKVWRRFLRDS
jgi:hypothetical protein